MNEVFKGWIPSRALDENMLLHVDANSAMRENIFMPRQDVVEIEIHVIQRVTVGDKFRPWSQDSLAAYMAA